MVKYVSTGFPKVVSPKIELPSIEELLLMPFLNNVKIEDAYKYGCEFQKEVLDKTQFFGKNHIYVQWMITLQTPEISPVINQYALDKEWHVDGRDTYEENDFVFHLMVNETTSMTDFNTAEFELDLPSNQTSELISRINMEGTKENSLLVPQTIEPNRIYRFNNNHIHRAKRVTKPEFRFFYRVAETDERMPDDSPDYYSSFVFHGDRSPISNVKQFSKDGFINKVEFYGKYQ